jgi:predicted HicB family RNase H-like nuclease
MSDKQATLKVDEDVHRAVKAEAALRGEKLVALVTRLLREGLDRMRGKGQR